MKVSVIIVLAVFINICWAESLSVTNNTGTINVKGCCPQTCKPKVKVVEKKVEVPVVVEKVEYVDRVETKVVVKRVKKHNRISLLGGVGPTKLDRVSDSQVNLEQGPVAGGMYQYQLDSPWSLGGLYTHGLDGKSNHTVLGTVGYEF